jgi:predicted N-formylglutamate amidohydrolase
MSTELELRAPDEPAPVEILREGAPSPFLLICDHASNRVPRALAGLGLDHAALARHIAWDIGAAEVTRGLSQRLDATAILTTCSRLVVDANRRPGDPDCTPAISDETPVPGNAALSERERQARLAAFHAPYHKVIAEHVEAREAAGGLPILIAVHSCTPVMRGFVRPWEIGVLWNEDERLARPLIEGLAAQGLVVGDNEPYSGRDPHGYTLHVHAEPRGLAHVLFEVRQDLIDTRHGAERWADILAPALAARLGDPALRRRYGA